MSDAPAEAVRFAEDHGHAMNILAHGLENERTDAGEMRSVRDGC